MVVVACGSSDDADQAEDRPTAAASIAPTSTAPGVEPMKQSAPARLLIPSIDVSSGLIRLGLADDGTLEVPPGASPAGWFTGAPTPGEIGPAVIAGHVSYNGVDGVFVDLDELKPGDPVIVRRADGSTAVFAVTRVAEFAKSRFPSEAVYGNLDHSGLRLITCDGYDSSTGTYAANLVVFADLQQARV